MVRSSARPTDAELEILAVLWDKGPSTVRTVHAELEPRGNRGYTTILKLMQIMVDKGLLDRDDAQRSHVFRPTAERSVMQRTMVRDLVDRAFSGSTAALVMRALGSKAPTQEELSAIRELVDKLERKRRRGPRTSQGKQKESES